ncbi:MAG: general secretion pathway protein GspK [Pirellulales bacterium]|nr:general secretion pathway protein GspK [Pirellulales bacterium]
MSAIASCYCHLPRTRVPRRRRGSLLLTVLVAIVLLSLAAYTYTELTFTDNETSSVEAEVTQARRLAESGISFARYLTYLKHSTPLDGSVAGQQIIEMGGLYNNPSLFMGKIALDDPDLMNHGRFTVLAPDYVTQPGQTGIRFGLEDESSRINLNAVLLADAVSVGGSRDLLMQLPNMTEEIADSILDWIDVDDNPREFGAENNYYSGLAVPYQCANRSLTSVEELLLVRGVTPGLLFGIDGNRNHLQETAEANTAGVLGVNVQTEDGDLAISGWAAHLTLYSAESNLNPEGGPKVDLNNEDLQALSEELTEVAGFSEDWVNFIVAFRMFDEANNSNAEVGDVALLSLGDLSEAESARTFQSVLDLIGKDVEVTIPSPDGRDDDETILLKSPFPEEPFAMREYLPQIMDWCAINVEEVIPGRININQAPELILRGIPGAPEGFAEAVASARFPEPENADDPFRHETWLLYEGIVTLSEMKTLLPFVCAGGAVYRGQFVGFSDGGGPSARLEAVIDAGGASPRVLLWRNISHLGRGYDLGTLGSGAQPASTGFNQ